MAAEDPSVSGVSGRYATALFELARDEKSIDAVRADLDRFEAMLADSADLKRLVRSPVFSSDAQSKALADRKSTRLNSSHTSVSRMPSSA